VRRAAWAAVLASLALLAPPGAAAQSPHAERLRALGLTGYGKQESPPAFSALIADGGRVSLAGLRGKVVLLTFWATWCPPCREEMSAFERLHRDLAAAGLVVLGVNAREDAEPIVEYARTNAVSFPLAIDPDGKVNTAYGIVALPTTFVIARNGRAVGRAVGARAWDSDSARALIRALLEEDD
jgi:peroxiredoxin